MPLLTMHLVIEHSEHFGSGTIYNKSFYPAFLPRKGDRVVLFPYPGEPAWDGPMGTVKEVCWGSDGRTFLDLEHFVVDPNEQMEQAIRLSVNTSSPLHGWYTKRDGDLRSLLASGQWNEGLS